MKLSKAEVAKHVIEVLREMSEVEGAVITPEINPIESLALDSGNGIPFALEMEDRLGIAIPPEVNPFVKDSPTPCDEQWVKLQIFCLNFQRIRRRLKNECFQSS